jgi:DNA-binding transcriptional regulator YhcF (GntR family)
MTRREKLFGHGRAVPLDREAKIKLMHRARVLVRTREIGRADFVIFETLLYTFHNGITGRCFPSYEKIAESSGAARSTVHLALHMLEKWGLLTWHNRLIRVRRDGQVIPVRTSNAYQFPRLTVLIPKSENRTGTTVKIYPLIESNSLNDALQRLGTLVRAHKLV